MIRLLSILLLPLAVHFSFGGGCFYDTGIGMQSGTATMHVISVTVQ